ncbi:MAG: tRNA preQ1(34) S-adenosylmethionine ribosyltransferase-isomerase QueA [Gammaproteobacteria bacterium]|nr:tRNA preQ1(34) S-adenosylmethionine ribosyltransferase-isomerase QueA [Gammaproteobacteria bacterium]
MNKKTNPLSLDDFDYELPSELIAQLPGEQRDQSRLLIVPAHAHTFTDLKFFNLSAQLKAGDLLVLNNTKVFPARLHAKKESGGQAEILAERLLDGMQVKAQVKASRSPKVGGRLLIAEGVQATVIGREDAFFILQFEAQCSLAEIFNQYGHMPLPPYIEREDAAADRERYQTVYAEALGAVAAPTAGLHFTPELLHEIETLGVGIAYITLHVGAGTYKPVKVSDVEEHKMHAEHIEVNDQVCQQVKATRAAGGRVFAVGTTCVRALESAAQQSINAGLAELRPYTGDTDIFIYPGYQFQVIDGLITNFHLPRSTLLMLVSALAGQETIAKAYRHAVEQRYRFFSYGDAMLILT